MAASGSARPLLAVAVRATTAHALASVPASGVHLALAARVRGPPPRALRWRTFLAVGVSIGSSWVLLLRLGQSQLYAVRSKLRHATGPYAVDSGRRLSEV